MKMSTLLTSLSTTRSYTEGLDGGVKSFSLSAKVVFPASDGLCLLTHIAYLLMTSCDKLAVL